MNGDSGGATMASQSSILKEIYEGKGKKMADQIPPFMKGKGAKPDPRMEARKKAAAKKLEALKKGK